MWWWAHAVLKPERLARILEAYIAQSAEGDAPRRERLARARKNLTEAAAKKSRLMQLVSAGALEPDDPQLVQEVKGAEVRRRQAEEEVALLDGKGQSVEPRAITPAKVERLGTAIRKALQTGTPEFRRAYVRLFVRQVVVDDTEIRVSGPTAALAGAVARQNAEGSPGSGSQFHAEWRPIGDSNPCCRRESFASPSPADNPGRLKTLI
jgi:hypothetical protein